jgi:5'-methylthioadenosine phosphorylase
MHQNVKRAKKVIHELVPLMDNVEPCCCAEAAKQAVVTEPVKVPEKLKKDLSILFD